MKFALIASALVGLTTATPSPGWNNDHGNDYWGRDHCDLDRFFCKQISDFEADFCPHADRDHKFERQICNLSDWVVDNHCPRRFSKREAEPEALASPVPGWWRDDRRDHKDCRAPRRKCRKAERIEDKVCDAHTKYYNRKACYIVSHVTNELCDRKH